MVITSPTSACLRDSRFFSALLPALVVLALVSSSALGQQLFLENGNPHPNGGDTGFLLDTPTRIKLDLSGNWNYLRGNGDNGVVRVPHAYPFTDQVQFERTFTVTAEQLDAYQFHLVLFGVNYATEIAINGDYVGSHTGGLTSVVFTLPPNILQVGSENTVRLTVDNRLDRRRTIPLRPSVGMEKNYGGVIRDVFLLGTPRLYIKDVVLSSEILKSGTRAMVRAKVELEGPDTAGVIGIDAKSRNLNCLLELTDKVSDTTVQRGPPVVLRRNADGWEPAELVLPLDQPRLWSPDTPDLYVARCYIMRGFGDTAKILDRYDLNLGIRSIEPQNGDFFVNGKRTVLRGVIWYEDHPTWGASLPYEQMERDIVLMKSLGATVVRFAERPPHPYMLNLCDRYGLFALEEIPVRAPGEVLAEEGFVELAGVVAREMVLRDRNHPSVFGWGIGDEFDVGHPAARQYVESVVREIRALDPRPVYYAARINQMDRCSDLVGFVGLNAPDGDIKLLKSVVEEWRARHRETPLVVLRLGTEVLHDNKNGYADPLSQQAQARFFLQRFDALRTLDVDGTFVWSLNDWPGDRPSLTVHSGDPYLQSRGLVSAEREKRIAYDAVRSIFQNEKFVALPQGGVRTTAPIIYVLAGFVLLVGLAYIYNASRRFRETLHRSLLSSYNLFADVRDQHIVPVFHSTVLALIAAGASAIVVSSILLHFRDSLFLDNILSLLLVSDEVKVAVVKLVWDPLRFILVAAAGLFIGLLLASLFTLALKIVLRSRIQLYHAYTAVCWSASPLLILIPVGMILFRIMDNASYVLPALILVGVLHLWVFARYLKSVAIVFDVRPVRIVALGWLGAIAVAAGLYAYYEFVHSAPMYISFWYTTLVGGG